MHQLRGYSLTTIRSNNHVQVRRALCCESPKVSSLAQFISSGAFVSFFGKLCPAGLERAKQPQVELKELGNTHFHQ